MPTPGKGGTPDDLVLEPPIPCEFKPGDLVVFTNDYGVQFDLKVRGFAEVPHTQGDDPRFIYVFKDAWWLPVSASSLRKRRVLVGTCGARRGTW